MPVDTQLNGRLKLGPVALFLGQDYLRIGRSSNPITEILQGRYPNVSAPDDSITPFLESLSGEEPAALLAWLHRRSEKIPISEALSTVSDFAWNNVYSSAIDEVWVRAFAKKWRSLNPLFTDRKCPQDLRDKHRLCATFLFGCVNKEDRECRIPLAELELDVRRQAAIILLRRLPDIITPRGVLLIDGWNPKTDWIRSEDFYPVLNQLEAGQVFIFSPSSEMRADTRLRNLEKIGVLQFVNQFLAEYLQLVVTSSGVPIGDPGSVLATGRQITLNGKPCFIPKESCLEVERFGVILDDNLTLPPRTRNRSSDENYFDFLRFLEQPIKLRNWEAYAQGLPFVRDCFRALLPLVEQALVDPVDFSLPLILHGETGTGKTVALATLAYQVASKAEFPVVFIDRSSKDIEWRVLDRFLNWAEDSGANACLIVWDGMRQEKDYLQLLNRLSDRGRKVVVVGSSYLEPESVSRSNFILAERTFKPDERGKFTAYIEKFAPDLAARIKDQGPRFIDPAFLVALYRLLPPVRPAIRTGIAKELQNDQEVILERIRHLPIQATGFNTLEIAMEAAGLKGDPTESWISHTDVLGETISTLQRLFATVMTVGRYGCNVPIELLLAALDQPLRPALLECLKTNSLVWHEAANGDLSVGPRHPLEAQLYVESLFGGRAESEASLIRTLIIALPRPDSVGSEVAIDFIIDLLRLIGPNSSNSNYRDRFAQSILKFAEALTEARTTRGILSPRLLLQEGAFYREGVRKNEDSLPLDQRVRLLREAVTVLELAQAIPTQSHRQRSVISEELAACLGSLIHNEAPSAPPNRIRELYASAKDAVRKAHAAEPDNVHATVTLSWISRSLIEEELFKPEEQNEVSAELLYMFDAVEESQLDYTQLEYYNRERMKLMEILGNSELSEAAFNQLCKIGSKAGYYLRARSYFDVIPTGPLAPALLRQVRTAMAYLEANWSQLEQDLKCVGLYFSLWWRLRLPSKPFEVERTILPFTDEEWQKCYALTDRLFSLSGPEPRPTHRFLRALAAFHTCRIELSSQEFRSLASDNTITVGGRRLRKSFVASRSGQPMVFTGTVRHPISEHEVGRIYVDQIRSLVAVIPRDFDRKELHQNESLSDFNIAFNFTGPIAQPSHYLRTR